MSECTQPGLWPNRPGSNASEDEVARYLVHLEQCPFHSTMENADDRMVQRIAAFANSEVSGSVNRQNTTGRQIRWAILVKVAAAIALAAGMVFLSMYLFRTRSTPQQVSLPSPSPTPSPSPSPPAEVITDKDAIPAPSVAPNINDRSLNMSIASVKRIYVAPAEGEYNQLLRAALIEEIKQCEKLTIATRIEDADAVLETEGTRGPNVRVQLVNRAGRPIWFTTQSTADESKDAAKGAAARIVRDLIYAAKPMHQLN